MEEDLVVRPNYIKFMLDSLEFYRDQLSVFSISGFCFPIEKEGYAFDTIMHTRFCCYGWASWSDRVKNVIWDEEKLAQIQQASPGFKKRLDAEGQDLFRTFSKQLQGTISTWDIQMQVEVAEKGLKVVYPVDSKTTNIGFDNESTNTFGVDYLKTVLDSGEKRSFRFCPADMFDPFMQQQLRKPYSFLALASRKVRNTLIKLTAQVKVAAE